MDRKAKDCKKTYWSQGLKVTVKLCFRQPIDAVRVSKQVKIMEKWVQKIKVKIVNQRKRIKSVNKRIQTETKVIKSRNKKNGKIISYTKSTSFKIMHIERRKAKSLNTIIISVVINHWRRIRTVIIQLKNKKQMITYQILNSSIGKIKKLLLLAMQHKMVSGFPQKFLIIKLGHNIEYFICYCFILFTYFQNKINTEILIFFKSSNLLQFFSIIQCLFNQIFGIESNILHI